MDSEEGHPNAKAGPASLVIGLSPGGADEEVNTADGTVDDTGSEDASRRHWITLFS